MRIVVAPDKFKGTLSALEAARAIGTAVRIAAPNAVIDICPLADGGEGTAEILAAASGGRMHACEAHDPLGRPLSGRYAELDDGWAAVDLAEVSGLPRLRAEERAPERASTFGTGELIRCAAQRGLRKVILGVGGSATIDGGIGIAVALGCRFLGPAGEALEPIAANLARITSVVHPTSPPFDELVLASDVQNPLLGDTGAARVYGEQKGASAQEIARIENGLRSLAALFAASTSIGPLQSPLASSAGFGAGGGVALSLVSLFGARIELGAAYVCRAIGFAQRVAGSDLLIVGEGRLDSQSTEGKAPLYAAGLAAALGVPVVAVAGQIALDARVSRAHALRDAEACSALGATPPTRPEQAAALLQRAAERVMRRFLGRAL
ncbi:MAG: glycerate kinase [Myxococcales bacterium]|nr:glycerate kinase [Myxococcales bacterium]